MSNCSIKLTIAIEMWYKVSYCLIAFGWYSRLKRIRAGVECSAASKEDTGSTAEQNIPECLFLQKTQKLRFALKTIEDFPARVHFSREDDGLQIGTQGRTELIRLVFSDK